MEKKGKVLSKAQIRFWIAFCLAIIMFAFLLNIIVAEEDKLTIKFHSSGDGKNISVDLAKYLQKSEEYFYGIVHNVSIFVNGSVATIVPKIGWAGDEIITFFTNKSMQEEVEEKKANLKITNLEPLIEMSFPATKNFVISPGQVEFSVVAFDPDNDVITVDWFVNGKLESQERAEGGIISHFIYNQTANGKRSNILKNEKFQYNITSYVVNAIVNDSINSKSLEWHFNVVNQTCIDIWQCGNWSDCTLSKRYRECKQINPKCEFDTYKPSTEWIDPICIEKQIKCTPNWTCSGWQPCKLDYNVNVVLSGKIIDAIKTKQARLCQDFSYCIGSVGMEMRDCNGTIPIKTRRVEWCNGKYIEIFNQDTGQFISRIREFSPEESPHLDIELSLKELSTMDHCWYCYDGIKDYGEKGVDCGGSCADCTEISTSSSFLDFLPIISFIFADILLAAYIILWMKKK